MHKQKYDIVLDSIPLSIIELQPLSIGMAILFAVVLSLILLSAFVSAANSAFLHLISSDSEPLNSENQLSEDPEFFDKQSAMNRVPVAERRKELSEISDLIKNPKYLISTILILEVVVDSALIIASVLFLDNILVIRPFVFKLFVCAAIITVTILLFCKVIPKNIALHNPIATAVSATGVIKTAQKILLPLNKVFAGPLSVIDKKLSSHKHSTNISIDDLSQALELTSDNIAEDTDILKGIVTLGSTTVASIMTPRLDMTAIEIRTPFDKVIAEIAQSEFSRIPVYNNSLDNIRGILYAKDLIPHIDKSANFKWQTLIRPPYFVPETKKTDDLLQEFQSYKIHIAVVVDEFGGTSGIVTMEDVLEQVVGEISDEHDEDNRLYTKDTDGSFIFEGKISLSDFFKIKDITPEDFDDYTENVDTLAGLILELKGNFPEVNELIKHRQYVFEVKEIEAQRILKVKLSVDNNKKALSDEDK